MGSAYRHTRQVRLAEVGEEGQARLAAATADVVSAGFAGEVEARYLAAAGVGTLRVREGAHAEAARAMDAETAIAQSSGCSAELAAPAAIDALDPAARDVAVGAWRALARVRELLSRAKEGTPR